MTSRSRHVIRGGVSLVCCLGGAFIGYAGSPANGHIPDLPHIVWLHTLAACLVGGAAPWLFAAYLASNTLKRLINIESIVFLSVFFVLAVRLPFAIEKGNASRAAFNAKVNSRHIDPPRRDVEGSHGDSN